MKIPYRVGDTILLPIGDGSTVEATIVAHDRRTVDIAVSDLMLRVSDRALVLHRWKRLRGPSSFEARLRLAPQDDRSINKDWIGPAHAERVVATHLGIASFELPALRVHNEWKPEFPPDSRYLRIAQRGITLDPRELARFPHLEVLDCSGIALTSFTFPRTLRALRLARISTPVDLRELEALPLQALHLEELRELRGVEALARLQSLQQLEMLGFWQLSLDDVLPLLAHRNLVRAEVDIGGRRKNVELYKRANWAYPWPFEIFARRI
ncbi:MAG: hypothetical protein WBD74_10345 [Candidatus Aquilonibacter sp.]